MSVHASKWAWSQECPTPTAKLVLMALADHANADGECYPTMKRVAELADCSTRTVSRAIQALEDAGLVRRVERRMQGGEYRGWLYQLAMPTSGQDVQRTDCPADAGGRVQWTPVSPQEPSVEPSTPLPPQAGESADGLNPRAKGTNPRARGTNPRALAEARRKREQEAKRRAYEVGTPEYEARIAAEQEARERLAGS